MRAALEHFAGRADGAGHAPRLVTALSWYWFLRGRLGECQRSLRRALAVPGTAPSGTRSDAARWLTGLRVLEGERPGGSALGPVPDRGTPQELAAAARSRWFVGYALATVADVPAAGAYTAAALDSFEALGDRWGIAAALIDRASYAMAKGDLTGAAEVAARSSELFREIGDRWGELQVSFALGTLASITGRYEHAERQHREAVRMAEELGLWPEVSYQLSWLGRVALLTGRSADAEELHRRAVRVAVEHGFAPGRVYALTGLALGARRSGELDAAEEHLHELLAWHRGVEDEPGNSLILAELGFVAELRGDAATALDRQLDGYAIARRQADPRALALAMEGLAGAVGLAGAADHAARLLGAATEAREAVGAPLPPGERGDVARIAAAARTALGEDAFVAEFARGATAEPHALVAAASSSALAAASPVTAPPAPAPP